MIRKALQFKIVPRFGTNKIPITLLFFFFNIFFIHLFVFGCTGSSLLLSGFLSLRRAGSTLCCSARASHLGGFSCFRAQARGAWASVAVAGGLRSYASRALEHWLSSCGVWALIAPRHAESSWTRDQTHVPCTGRWTVIHCTTREFPLLLF